MSTHCNKYPECGCPPEIGVKCSKAKVLVAGGPEGSIFSAEDAAKLMEELGKQQKPPVVNFSEAEQKVMTIHAPERYDVFPEKSGQEKRRERRKNKRRKR